MVPVALVVADFLAGHANRQQSAQNLDFRQRFFALWSQKEALLKALGCGWANGNVVRNTRLELADFQTEPTTRVRVWSRRVLAGTYALAVAIF